jgi:hypothetical protein
VCAQCHGPRLPVFPILDQAHRFRPGDAYADSYTPLVLLDGRERSGEFWTDGRPSSSSFEYQALIQSRCHRMGGATCLTCHTPPHDEHGPDDLRLPEDPPAPGVRVRLHAAADASCVRCHRPVFAEGARHTRHTAAAAQSCVGCHMPRTLSGVLDRFADHALDVPSPRNTARYGIPNACSTCHRESPATLDAGLRRLWPGVGARLARRERLADAFAVEGADDSRSALRAILADATEAPSLRGVAAELIAIRFPSDVEAVLPLLSDPDPLLRQRAASALGLAEARGLGFALLPLLKDPSLSVRQTAALLLTLFGAPEGETALRALADAPATAGLEQPPLMLGALAARTGDLDTARTRLEQARRAKPYNAGTLLMLSEVYQARGEGDRARAAVDEAATFEPGSPQIAAARARLP